MIQKKLGDKVVLKPANKYIVKQGELCLRMTMIVPEEQVSLYREATDADIQAYNEFRNNLKTSSK